MILQLFLLSLLLLVTPYVSWRYLSDGLQYRKDNLQGLSDLGQLPNISWLSVEGDTVRTDDWQDHIALIVLSDSPGTAAACDGPLLRIREQFQDRGDVGIYHFRNAGMLDSVAGTYPEGMVELDSTSYQAIVVFTRGLPDYRKASQALILVDRHHRVRKVFDISKHSDLQYLARVVAILLPPKKVEKPVLKREAEK